MRIAILDYRLVPTNAIGNGNRRVIAGLKDRHDFTAFGLEIENPDPARVRWVRAPVPGRPLFLLFVTYHLWAPLALWRERRRGAHFDLVQSVESNTLLGDVLVVGFCHRAYLRDHWAATRPAGLRGVARWLDHVFHSLLEPLAYRRARVLVAPSRGLEREVIRTYGKLAQGKTVIIPFAVNVERMQRPADFDREGKRASLGAGQADLLMVFTALGHFERKGLPLLLEGMAKVAAPNLRLVVVGGQPGTIQEYEKRAAALGLSAQVKFVGHQQDVRPFLWAADLFAFPSSYETFSLVTFEAAAAGVPLLVSQLHGVEDMLRDGENGWLVQRDAADIAAKIRLALQDPDRLRAMGARAAEGLVAYDEAHVVARWAALYDDYEKRR